MNMKYLIKKYDKTTFNDSYYCYMAKEELFDNFVYLLKGLGRISSIAPVTIECPESSSSALVLIIVKKGSAQVRSRSSFFSLFAGESFVSLANQVESISMESDTLIYIACIYGNHTVAVANKTVTTLGHVIKIPTNGNISRAIDRSIKFILDIENFNTNMSAHLAYSMICDVIGITFDSELSYAYHPLFVTILDYVEKNYASPDALSDLASRFGISQQHLIRLFKTNFHTTPQQYVIKKRITEASRLLSFGTASIEEIASRCGFSNQYYFMNTFKKIQGVTPTEYRKRHLFQKMP